MKSTPYEIAVSFINGNLSWVKDQCKKKPEVVASVYLELKEINKEQSEAFMRWVYLW